MKKWLGVALSALLSGALAGCFHGDDDAGFSPTDSDADQSRLRVLHAAGDAPPLDVLVDGTELLTAVAYRQGSGYLTVDAGPRDVSLRTTVEQTGILEASVNPAADRSYSLLAIGKVGDQSIEPLLLEEDGPGPGPGAIRLRFVHAAPDTTPLDVYLTEPTDPLAGEEPRVSGISYRGASQFLEVDAGDYRIRITPEGQTAAIYDSGPVSLQDGAVISTVALPTPGTQNIGLVGLSDDAQNPVFQLANIQETRLRTLHGTANGPVVDVRLGGSVIVSGLAYKEASGYLNVSDGAPGMQINLTATDESITDTVATLEAGRPYTVVALGSYPDDVAPLLLRDEVAEPSIANARLRVVHAAVDLSPVDVYVTTPEAPIDQAAPAVANTAFRGASGYLIRQPGEYRIRITAAGEQTVLFDSGTLVLDAGMVLTTAAVAATGGSSPVSLVALSDDPVRAAFEIPDIHAEVRAVHASPGTPALDLVVDGQTAFTAIAFGNASAYTEVTPGEGPVIALNETGTTSSVVEISPALMRGLDYTLMGVNFPSEIETLLLAEDDTPPEPGNSRLRLTHASPNTPAVDVLINGETAASGLEFTETTDYLQLPAGEHTVTINDAGTGSALLRTTVSAEDGSVYTAAAIGQLTALEILMLTDN